MTEPTSIDTRARILDAAMELFAARGYLKTSLRQIAERLGVTKAAVLYHFPAKIEILAALSEPLLRDLEAVVDAAAELAPAAGRRAVLEGLLDTYLAHRAALYMTWHDLAILSQQPSVYQRFLTVGRRAARIIAGPGADLTALVHATQAMAGLGDPVLYFPDSSPEELRAAVLAGAHRILGDSGSPSPPDDLADGPGTSRRGRPGRPRRLDGQRLAEARRMRAAGGHSIDQIAAAVGVSRATLYRYLDRPGNRLKTKVYET